jgi:uracil-DNA glycosylase family 4
MSKSSRKSSKGRADELARLARRVSCCPRCPALVENRTQPVFGVGRAGAKIMLVGEAPGAEEDRRGEPFVGAAGKRLNKLLEKAGLRREALFITNVIKCRPPSNRKPQADEIANCREYLQRQIELVRPAAICALGTVAAHWFTGGNEALKQLLERRDDYRGIPVVFTYHPAYVVRNPAAEPAAIHGLKRAAALV